MTTFSASAVKACVCQCACIVCLCLHSGAYLWLGEHVQAPGAHLAICGDADQVVGVLGAHHVHTVHRVLGDRATETRQLQAQG